MLGSSLRYSLHANRFSLEQNILPLVPHESFHGHALSIEEQRILSEVLAEVYEILTEAFAAEMAAFAMVPQKSARFIVRAFVVSICHVFYDRLIRLRKVSAGRELCVFRAEDSGIFEKIEDFQNLATISVKFNQYVLSLLAESVAQLPLVNCSEELLHNDVVAAKPFLNHNNMIRQGLIGKMAHRILYHFFKVVRLGAVPVFDTGRIKLPLLRGGLFRRNLLLDMDGEISVQGFPLNEAMRRGVVSAALERARRALDTHHKAIFELAGLPSDRIIGGLNLFFEKFIPTALFEGANFNFSEITSTLAKYRESKWLGEGTALTTRGVFVKAAARQFETDFVTIQHGGHYGYIFDFGGAIETEFTSTDYFLTWGWREMPKHPHIHVKAVLPLPSPVLDQFRKNWAHDKSLLKTRSESAEFDLLFFPNKIKAFPSPPSGIAESGPDKVGAYKSLFVELGTALRDSELSMIVKPYDLGTGNILAQTYNLIKELLGSRLAFTEHHHKGLTPELAAKCHIVLLDQPGTAFCECLVVGQPVMVFWPRTINFECPNTIELFENLEKVGIVHRTAHSLALAVSSFKLNPKRWQEDPERKRVSSEFLNQFAYTSPDWPKKWKKFLKALNDS